MMPLLTTLLAVSLGTPFDAPPRPATPASAPLEYVSPVPGSRYHLPAATMIIRPGGAIGARVRLDGHLLTVRGSVSGDHPGRLSESDDGETLVFEPFESFAPGEEVSWRLGGGLRTDTRGPIQAREFTFLVAGEAPGTSSLRAPADAVLEDELDGLPGGSPRGTGSLAPRLDASGSDLPGIHPIAHGPHSPGNFFLADMSLTGAGYQSTLMIVDDEGVPIFARKVRGRALDFKLQPNGWLTYFDASAGYYYALDSSFAVVDSFRCGNGYATDLHDLRLLPDGHALLMSYDPQTIDMSKVVPGGQESARVAGLIVQELDRAKRVVFQWRSWDNYQITDATDRDFTAAVIDYAHGNSVEKDTDGNLIVSSRHMDEVTKISRRTGEMVWRWGGKNNQFTFVNDPIGFSHQHHVRRIANGNVTLFDNGFYHSPPFSRAVEYRLDEARRTATLVWEHRPTPPVIAYALGSVQRLDSGNTVIGWGSVEGTTVTEVTPAGEVVAGLALDRPLVSYRSFRFDWPPAGSLPLALQPDPTKLPTNPGHGPQPFRIDRVSGAGALPVQIRIAEGAGRTHTVSVFDTRGRLLRRWAARADAQGRLFWDGSRSGGGVCASGVYFIRVDGSEAAAVLKVVIVR
jgi:hypothetical protein